MISFVRHHAIDRRGVRSGCGSLGIILPTGTWWRFVNTGTLIKVRLEEFIGVIEAVTGKTAFRNYLDMQSYDVPAMWADNSLLWAPPGAARQCFASETDQRGFAIHPPE